MSIESSGLIPQEVQDAWKKDNQANFLKKKDDARKNNRRSTFTSNNAELFKPFFDSVIQKGGEQMLPWDTLKVTEQTLYVKVCDALKYLIENEPNEAKRNSYALLKGAYKICPETQGIVLRQRHKLTISIAELSRAAISISESYGVGSRVIDVSNTVKQKHQTWKDLVEAFVNDTTNETKEQTVTFDSSLNDEEKIWIANVFGGAANLDFMIVGNELQMMKVKL